MTDVTTPAAATATDPAPPAAPAPAEPKLTTIESIFAAIRYKSSLNSLKDVKQTVRVVWQDPDGKRFVIRALDDVDGGKTPAANPFVSHLASGSPTSIVMGIFHDEEEIRVYTLPIDGKGFPTCYCLSKREGRSFVEEIMHSVEKFVDVMADEYRAAGEAEGVIDDDDDDALDEEIES